MYIEQRTMDAITGVVEAGRMRQGFDLERS